jgi:hypothetical protein
LKIYLASNYQSHPRMMEVRDILYKNGHKVTSRWIDGNHEVTSLDHCESRKFAEEDLEDLKNSNLCIWFSVEQSRRNRGGRHVEFGAALAWGIQIFVVGKKENVFHYLEEVRHFSSLDEILEIIN